MFRAMRFLCGLVAGALVGGALALLWAPRPGAETRALLEGRVNEIRSDALQAYADKRRELLDEFERAKHPPVTE